MTSLKKEDLINSVYRGEFLSKNGADPGDIIGPNNGDDLTLIAILAMFGFMIIVSIYKSLM